MMPNLPVSIRRGVIALYSDDADDPLRAQLSELAAMLGYAIGRPRWGRGIATEAARAVMAWGVEAFRTLIDPDASGAFNLAGGGTMQGFPSGGGVRGWRARSEG